MHIRVSFQNNAFAKLHFYCLWMIYTSVCKVRAHPKYDMGRYTTCVIVSWKDSGSKHCTCYPPRAAQRKVKQCPCLSSICLRQREAVPPTPKMPGSQNILQESRTTHGKSTISTCTELPSHNHSSHISTCIILEYQQYFFHYIPSTNLQLLSSSHVACTAAAERAT